MSEELWTELEAVTATLDRLQTEIRRCQGHSAYRAKLVAERDGAERRRAELVTELAARG